MKLANKVAIVTGASRGLGRTIAITLAKEGASVAVVARSEKSGDHFLPGTIADTAAQIEALGGQALAIRTDLTKEEEVRAMVAQTKERFGHIDILVNNAAINFVAPVHELSVRRWDLVLSVGLRAVFLCCQAVLPTMMEQRSGSIINISSILGKRAIPYWSAYCTSKAGVEHFTRVLAQEVKQYNIAVNSLAPASTVVTEGFSWVMGEGDKSEWDPPEVMGRAAAFLATLDANTFTGEIVTDRELFGWRDLIKYQG